MPQLRRWKSKLFLEPFKDKKVLFVAAALLGTIIVVAITIGILQWRERVRFLHFTTSFLHKFCNPKLDVRIQKQTALIRQ